MTGILTRVRLGARHLHSALIAPLQATHFFHAWSDSTFWVMFYLAGEH